VGQRDKIDWLLENRPPEGMVGSRQVRRLIQSGHEDDRQTGADAADNFVDQGQAQARALTGLLCGEEWFKNPTVVADMSTPP